MLWYNEGESIVDKNVCEYSANSHKATPIQSDF